MNELINIPLLATYLKYFLLVYLAVISVIAVIVCVFDKNRAKRQGRRVSEADLLLISALGGSVFMFITMLIIRHKTKHIKFMAGIPAIMLLQAVLAFLIIV